MLVYIWNNTKIVKRDRLILDDLLEEEEERLKLYLDKVCLSERQLYFSEKSNFNGYFAVKPSKMSQM
jgi:hypothetical protein